MRSDPELSRQLLAMEAQAWQNLTGAEYDRAVCEILGRIAPSTPQEATALLVLATRTFCRERSTAVESVARLAERLLTVGASTPFPTRVYLLILLAWYRIATVAAQGPETISRSPALPTGAELPSGADWTVIADPILRERAQGLGEQHAHTVQQWNAKQNAIEHLYRTATLVRAARSNATAVDDFKVLQTAMSLAPGLPDELRSLLQKDAG